MWKRLKSEDWLLMATLVPAWIVAFGLHVHAFRGRSRREDLYLLPITQRARK